MKTPFTQRHILQEAGLGFGAVAFGAMMAERHALAATAEKQQFYNLAAKAPHFASKAKNVIYIYVGGGPSTIDMWDQKPTLSKYNGKPAPFEIKGRALNGSQQIMATPWPFSTCGQTGRQVSDLLPHFQKVVDEVSYVRSMQTDRIDH